LTAVVFIHPKFLFYVDLFLHFFSRLDCFNFSLQQNVTAVEKAAYDPRVDVYFQKNAWLDGSILREWTNRTLVEYLNRRSEKGVRSVSRVQSSGILNYISDYL
jgi:hypothetical protein